MNRDRERRNQERLEDAVRARESLSSVAGEDGAYEIVGPGWDSAYRLSSLRNYGEDLAEDDHAIDEGIGVDDEAIDEAIGIPDGTTTDDD